MRADNFNVERFVDQMAFTSRTLDNGLDYYYPHMKEDDLSGDEYEFFQNAIFFCESCDAWCYRQGEELGLLNCIHCESLVV